jgi:LAO/AO transport system kinase
LRDRPVLDLLRQAQGGDSRATARLVSLVENDSPRLREVMAALVEHAGHARTIGVTGAPGVGKSTLVTALVAAYRGVGERVGVLAIDPSSPFTGGAVLGDRVRMQRHATDDGVFIRSMASRGHLGGLSWATPQAVRVLDAVGYDVVVIETVGVGQSEVEVAGLADSTVVVLAPGLGDGIQAAKAGILETADVLVVNKSDRDGANQVVRDLTAMLRLGDTGGSADTSGWTPPVLRTQAQDGVGITELQRTLDDHARWLASTGRLRYRRRRQAREEIEALAGVALLTRARTTLGDEELDAIAQQVVEGVLDPYGAADVLVAAVCEA